jgi:hypothetical protein
MNRLQSISERRQLRKAALNNVVAGLSFLEALKRAGEMASTMSEEEQAAFIERGLAQLGKTKTGLIIEGLTSGVINKAKKILKRNATIGEDVKNNPYGSSGPMAERTTESVGSIGYISNWKVLTMAFILAGGFTLGALGFFEKENHETAVNLAQKAVSGIASLMSRR